MDPILITGIVFLLLLVVGVVYFSTKRKARPTLEAPKPRLSEELPQEIKKPLPEEESLEPEPQKKAVELVPEPADLGARLSRTRGLLGKLGAFLSKGSPNQFSNQEWDAIEEILLEADVGFQTTSSLIEKVRERAKSKDETLSTLIRNECLNLFSPAQELSIFDPSASLPERPFVVSIVGINGAGKTTTIGKLAKRLESSGRKVLLGAADTFRAGAISQLKVWSERVGCDFVAGREGADPGAVAFDSLTAAKARNVDVVLLDTAGRLHTKANLMAELQKINKVMKKVIPEAPHETWLVLDGTLGQNSLEQAREFTKSLGVTGIVITKLDGTAKGGAVLAIASELGVPVRFIGIGESVEDLIPFHTQDFVDAILQDK